MPEFSLLGALSQLILVKCPVCLWHNLCITLRQREANLYPIPPSSAVWIGLWNILYCPFQNSKQVVSIPCLLVAKACSICGCLLCVALNVFPLYPLSAQNMTSLYLHTWEKRKYWWLEYYGYTCCHSMRSDTWATVMRFRNPQPDLKGRWKKGSGKDAVEEPMMATKQTVLVEWLDSIWMIHSHV